MEWLYLTQQVDDSGELSKILSVPGKYLFPLIPYRSSPPGAIYKEDVFMLTAW